MNAPDEAAAITAQRPPAAAPSILYLEDDDDIRELLSDLLRHAGYDVTAVGSPEAALQALGRRRFDLLLADYRLPRHNADWVLEQAHAAHLLDDSAVIVLSGELSVPGVGDVQILRKPVDVGLLLSHIARCILEAGGAGLSSEAPALPAAVVDGVRVVLRLYVSASVESLNAERHLRTLLGTVDDISGRPLHELVSLQIFDVTKASKAMFDAVEEDRVIVTPTLVRRAPGARASFLGDLSRRGLVEAMLREAMAEPAPSSSLPSSASPSSPLGRP